MKKAWLLGGFAALFDLWGYLGHGEGWEHILSSMGSRFSSWPWTSRSSVGERDRKVFVRMTIRYEGDGVTTITGRETIV